MRSTSGLRTGLLVSGLVLTTLAGNPFPLYAASLSDPEQAAGQAHGQLAKMIFRIKMFHNEVRTSLTSTLELPLFAEYFTIAESGNNQYNDMGTLKVSPRQEEYRLSMEKWLLDLHQRFPIGESCLVDRNGQEHMRVVGGTVEKPVNFSDSEQDAPFFSPSFAINQGQVFFSTPYMSPDAYKWVVAFTSPVVLSNGSKPAFLHFEVPLVYYQELLITSELQFDAKREVKPNLEEEGRFFIVNDKNQLLADSGQAMDFDLKAERHPEKQSELPDYLPPERFADYSRSVTTISAEPVFLEALATAVKDADKEQAKTIHLTLGTGPAVLVYQKIPDRSWLLFHLDPIK